MLIATHMDLVKKLEKRDNFVRELKMRHDSAERSCLGGGRDGSRMENHSPGKQVPLLNAGVSTQALLFSLLSEAEL